MAVRIRLKKLGRRHRPYFRICVMDARSPRDGKVIEEVGTYDPLVRETDRRVTIKADRVDYWLGVGALPTEKVKILIDKYKGKVPEKRTSTRTERVIPDAPPPRPKKSKPVEVEEAPAQAPAPEPSEPSEPSESSEGPAEAAPQEPAAEEAS